MTFPGELEYASGRGSFGAAEEGQTLGRTAQSLERLLYCEGGESDGGGGWTWEEDDADHRHHRQQHWDYDNADMKSLLNGGKRCADVRGGGESDGVDELFCDGEVRMAVLCAAVGCVEY